MPHFDELPIHSQIKKHLKKLLVAPPSALLFEGPKGVGKGCFAKQFAYELLSGSHPHKVMSGHHPDLRELYPEGKGEIHSMETMKELILQIQLHPHESQYKIFIIYQADRMLPSSSHALLKTLEEPPSYAHFILVTSHIEAILPTISSRCFKVSFPLLTDRDLMTYLEKTEKKSPDEARQIAWLSHGSLSRAKGLAEKKDHKLFSLLADIGVAALHQNYPLLFSLLSELESFLQKNRVDPIEEILSIFYFWYRDLYLLKLKGDPSLLFFQSDEEKLRLCLECPLPDLLEVQKKLESILVALERHISLRHCLMELFI